MAHEVDSFELSVIQLVIQSCEFLWTHFKLRWLNPTIDLLATFDTLRVMVHLLQSLTTAAYKWRSYYFISPIPVLHQVVNRI